MLGPGRIMALALIFIALTTLGVIYESALFDQSILTTVQHLTGFTTEEAGTTGIGIVMAPLNFVRYGLPNLLTFNYAFLDTTLGTYVRFFLGTLFGIAIIWALWNTFAPIIGQLFTSIWNGILAGFRGLM
jgi:hypothetical protein